VLLVIGLVDLTRNRHNMETRQVAVWAAVLVLLPVVGLVSYLLWRLARNESMQDAIDFQDEHSAKGKPYPPIGR
jgi:hypothetical protein